MQDPFWIKDITLGENPDLNVNLEAAKNRNLECSVASCSATSNTDSIDKFFPLPICTPNMPPLYQLIEKKQQCAWIQSIIFKNENKALHVCSKHFHTGKLLFC